MANLNRQAGACDADQMTEGLSQRRLVTGDRLGHESTSILNVPDIQALIIVDAETCLASGHYTKRQKLYAKRPPSPWKGSVFVADPWKLF